MKTEQELELDYWKRSTAYLAECCAATLELSNDKLFRSKTFHNRFMSICEEAKNILKHERNSHPAYTPDSAYARCQEALLNAIRK